MNSFALLLVCFQACLVQSVFGQCLSRHIAIPTCGYEAGLAPIGYAGYGDFAYPAAGWAGGIEAYGGIGEGNVAVAGELPVAGSTAVAGQVPIMGAVKFAGPVCAAGSVSIVGKCARGCGCDSDLALLY